MAPPAGSSARALTAADYKSGAIGIFAAAMIVMAAAHTANTSWNVNSRMALVFAVVDRGTFAIDGYHGDNDILPTGDKAEFGGHVYSDKAFGVSLLCVPVYAAMQAVAKLFGFEWDLQWKIYLLRLVSTSIPAAIALALLWLLMVRAGALPRRALVAVAIAFFGSLWFGYSTLAMPYSPGIAASVAAIYLICYPPLHWFPPSHRSSREWGWPSDLWSQRGDRNEDNSTHVSSGRAAAIGLLCGFALICDFLFGPIVVVAIGMLFLTNLTSQAGLKTRLYVVASAVLGGAIPLALFATYTYSIFGTVALPYQYEVEPIFREGMSRGVMGVTTPRLGPLWFLTFHPFRGIFFWSPWILVALAGCVMAARRAADDADDTDNGTGMRRAYGWMGLLAFGSALFISSGYYMWWGGFSMGPRLMLPMMAAVPLGLTEICRRERARGWWWALVATGAISVALSMPLALTDPQMPQLEDTAKLLKVTLASKLPAPQFEFLRMYYGGEWFWGPQSHHHLLRVLPLVGIALGSLVLIRTARRLPGFGAER